MKIWNLSRAGDGLILKVCRDAADSGEPGKFIRLQVFHDDWCSFLKGTGECDCEPDIKAIEEAGE